MTLNLFFHAPNRRPARRPLPARPRRSFPPRLTALEDRTVPSSFTVTSLGDSGPGTLRAGVSSGANVIQFAHGLDGTIHLASEIDITASLKIEGPGADQVTVSGDDATRVFSVSGSGTKLTIDDLTIANGLAPVSLYAGGDASFGGGLLNNGASVSLDDVVFVGNQAGNGTTYAGGGAVANLGGHFTADHTDFLVNSADGASTDFSGGGAVYDDERAIVTIADGTFSGNVITAGNANGGAIGHYGGSRLTLDDISFNDNKSVAEFPGPPPSSQVPIGESADGGAIETDQNQGGYFTAYYAFQPTMTISNSSFTGNVVQSDPSPAGQVGAQVNGGAIDLEAMSAATISNSTFVGNLALGGDGGAGGEGEAGGDGGGAIGGAIDLQTQAAATISNSTFDGNVVVAGSGGDGGPGMDGGAGNVGKGGAIFNNSGSIIVSNSQFIGNRAIAGNGGNGGSGGGNGGDGNYSNGGAINSTAGNDDPVVSSATISNCLIVGNLSLGGSGGAGGSGGGNGGAGARGDGGGVGNFYGPITISNSTIVDNTAQGGAGGAPGSGGGVGGAGGLGRSGGLANERGSTGTIINTSIVNNQAIGGVGGAGNSGGNAIGGGVYNGRESGPAQTGSYPTQEATLEIVNSTVAGNLSLGGAGGAGGDGGFASGGGIYNGTTDAAGNPLLGSSGVPLLDLDGTDVIGNEADGGAAGAGGVGGAGVGGGLYNDSSTGSIAQVDHRSRIKGNIASTSNDDIFGTITPI